MMLIPPMLLLRVLLVVLDGGADGAVALLVVLVVVAVPLRVFGKYGGVSQVVCDELASLGSRSLHEGRQ
jgi:hypothetical protein